MSKELFGIISGLVVVLSAIPYTVRAWQRKTRPVVTSWALWTLIGFALLVTYRSSGASANVWPAVFGFVNPIIIVLVAIYRGGERQPLTRRDWICIAGCSISLAIWWMVREDKELSQWTLYLAIAADIWAAIPTIQFVYRSPEDERPGAWMLFGIGYGIGMLAISEHTIANYVLPAYMLLAPIVIVYPLIAHRVKNRAPITEWI